MPTLWQPGVALPPVLQPVLLALFCLFPTRSMGRVTQPRSQPSVCLGAGWVEAGTLSLYHTASLSDSRSQQVALLVSQVCRWGCTCFCPSRKWERTAGLLAVLTDPAPFGAVTTEGTGAGKGEFQWCFSISSRVRFSFPPGSPDCNLAACSVLPESLFSLKL